MSKNRGREGTSEKENLTLTPAFIRRIYKKKERYRNRETERGTKKIKRESHLNPSLDKGIGMAIS